MAERKEVARARVAEVSMAGTKRTIKNSAKAGTLTPARARSAVEVVSLRRAYRDRAGDQLSVEEVSDSPDKLSASEVEELKVYEKRYKEAYE